MKPYDMSDACKRDLIGAIFGDHLGGGASRQTFIYEPNTNYVIKLEDRARWFQNIQEWNTWMEVKDTKHAKWFAPCAWISPCGTLLLQKRTEAVCAKGVPGKIPDYFTDLKLANFGLLNGRFVCHDYGIIKLSSIGLKSSRLIKPSGFMESLRTSVGTSLSQGLGTVS